MLLNVIEKYLLARLQSGYSGAFVLAHQTGVADHIRHQDGGELAFGGLFHGLLPKQVRGTSTGPQFDGIY